MPQNNNNNAVTCNTAAVYCYYFEALMLAYFCLTKGCVTYRNNCCEFVAFKDVYFLSVNHVTLNVRTCSIFCDELIK